MIKSPAKTLALLRSLIPRALVSPEALARVEDAASLAPPACGLFFERHLGSSSERVDFLLAISPAWGRDEMANGRLNHLGAGWAGLSSLCTAWATPTHPLFCQIPFIWVELDLHPTSHGIPQPFVTCCIQSQFDRGHLFDRSGEEGARVLRNVTLVAELLGQEPLTPKVAQRISSCFDALPDGASLMHVASNRVRGADSVRMVVTLSTKDVRAYLRRIGWPGDDAAIDRVVSVADFSNRIDLYLNVGGEVAGYLGAASMIFRSNEDPRARILLDRLVDWGACTPEQRDAALGWMGTHRAVLPETEWPASVRRYLSLKLAHHPGAPLEAKIYLELHAAFELFDDVPFCKEHETSVDYGRLRPNA
jgi:hypothetical protein